MEQSREGMEKLEKKKIHRKENYLHQHSPKGKKHVDITKPS